MFFNSAKIILLVLLIAASSCKEELQPNDNESYLNSTDSINKDHVQGKYLHSAEAVKKLLETRSDIVIFEISKEDQYRTGHLPGAYQIWRDEFTDNKNSYARGMILSAEETENLLSRYGVNKNSIILIYDAYANVEALRFLWILEMYGHKELLIINGGKQAWVEAGYPLDIRPADLPLRSEYKFSSKPKFDSYATLEDVKQGLKDSNTIIVDTREKYEYLGHSYIVDSTIADFKKGAYAAGRIPGAIHLNWSASVDLNTDHRFKSIVDLKYNFEKAGISKDKNIIVYCHSGTRSAHTMYVLKEILHYPNVKNYDGSWIEWSYLHTKENLEIEKTASTRNEEIRDSLSSIIKLRHE